MEDPVQAVVGTGVAAVQPRIPSNATSMLLFSLVVRVEPLLSSEVRADLTTGEASDLLDVAMLEVAATVEHDAVSIGEEGSN
jgi:hypothetical protein